ncbi:MAG TPA: hypothetical protein VF126_15000 [Acidobacteriaceae bacterium]
MAAIAKLSSEMRRDIRRSLLIGIGIFAIICALSSLFPSRGVDNFFMVGMRFAAVLFPAGIHSDAGVTFLALGIAIDVFVPSLLTFIVMRLISRRRETQELD